MKTVEVAQRSEDWFKARRGMPTASRFKSILTPVTGKPSSAQDTLINELIAESIMPPEQGVIRPMTAEMEHGVILEAEARCSYDLEHAKGAVKEVGFLIHESGLFGGSPDCLVGENGGCEIKCPNGSTLIGYIRDGSLPDEYKCQVHGYLAITKRDYWDFFAYSRNLPPFKITVNPDDFTRKLEIELFKFCERYNAEREKFGLPRIQDLKAKE